MTKVKSTKSFEEKLKRLEQISELLESGDVQLEESISLFEEGIKLSKECLAILENAELKITKLKKEVSNKSNYEGDDE
ncbi:Exodeoxyribonuclease VII small subunit [Ignavibacterium album JCM 16511]|uniref:Exodeoxyribonuclease 7 small subunit n=1 Tax=Ignavibacterium album (strain DSM 19864 / JCM 16511 / NBRC 101810 / Mat9-16) TaxID=945713 RepID=I0ALI3_IGNAJ|nr:exodeoxyribonuclease VII small subunit [Ignavibacterium album]AFH49840.1 Exodeoxyribonuclease VII small subunit [Ignavibacterium album JCM 16511]